MPSLPSASAPSRAAVLRRLLQRPEVTVLMEAHDGLSAKLAEEAGFEAIWASGLAISAALGVRDCNEASWTQVLEVIEFMADATRVPILVDGDTGHGNFNNARRLVAKLEQRGAAGVCLEDKVYPKTNSFLDGPSQLLAEVDEFCGKLRAVRDALADPDFVVVARTEAFVVGLGLEEALLRATAYAHAGADAVLVHTARSDSLEIQRFVARFTGEVPLVVVPTRYPHEPLAGLQRLGVHNFVFANQSIRAVVAALQTQLGRLRRTLDLGAIEADIAPLEELFRLQDVEELERSRARYGPGPPRRLGAIVLAAAQGDFGALVSTKPKCMLRVRGKALLARQLDVFVRHGVRDLAVVRGFAKEAVDLPGARYFDNDDYATTGELYSLYAARECLQGDVILAYGDVLFDDGILANLLEEPAPISVVVDAGWQLRAREAKARDLVVVAESALLPDPTGHRLAAIGPGVSQAEATGEWIGLVGLRAQGTATVRALLEATARDAPEVLRHARLDDLLGWLVQRGHAPAVVHTYGHWRDLDDPSDLLPTDEVS